MVATKCNIDYPVFTMFDNKKKAVCMCNIEWKCSFCSAVDSKFEDNPLSKVSFKSNLKNIFPAFYLTLVGVIQSSALALLISRNTPLFIDGEYSFNCVVYFVLTSIVICFVTLEYVTFTICFSWSPTIIDIATPFAIGVVESFLIFKFSDGNIDVFKWWNYMMYLFIFAIFSYGHALWRIEKFREMFVDKIFKIHESAFASSVYVSFFCSVFVFVGLLIGGDMALYIIAIIIFGLHLWKEHVWFKRVHDYYMVPYIYKRK